MKKTFITEVTQAMLPYLDNAQLAQLRDVLEHKLWGFDIIVVSEGSVDKDIKDNGEFVDLFIAAKKVEGCSDKTIRYYKATINHMLSESDKHGIPFSLQLL